MEAEKNLGKRQLKKIAVMWSAAIIWNSGSDSFDEDFGQGDEVVETCKEIAMRMLNGLPLLDTLPDIINYVKLKQ